MQFDAQVARLRSPEAGGFDISESRAGEIVNAAIRRLVVRSQILVAERELGPGVAGTYLYELPADVLDIRGLMVNGDPKFARVATTRHWQLRSGDAYLPPGRTGAYAPRFDTDGGKWVAIFPTPAGGETITALCAISSPDYADDDDLPLPEDGEQPLQWAAKAIAYEEIDEDPATAGGFYAQADAWADSLAQRERGRVGGGVIQAQIQGVHFR